MNLVLLSDHLWCIFRCGFSHLDLCAELKRYTLDFNSFAEPLEVALPILSAINLLLLEFPLRPDWGPIYLPKHIIHGGFRDCLTMPSKLKFDFKAAKSA